MKLRDMHHLSDFLTNDHERGHPAYVMTCRASAMNQGRQKQQENNSVVNHIVGYSGYRNAMISHVEYIYAYGSFT